MREFGLIEYLADTLGASRGALEGIGDDGAVLDVPADRQLVVSTDSLVEGVHFESGLDPVDIGYKALAVNLSDLAAMAAVPAWYFLNLTLPAIDQRWVEGFAKGLRKAAEGSGIRLAGGDTTSGPLSITITVCGLVKRGAALTRSGARPGDIVGISGPTGLAACALADLQQGRAPAADCLRALRRPQPRLGFGQALGELAHSGIDVSDGLLADLGHIARASSVGAEIELARLPSATGLGALPEQQRRDLQLGGGDDYELCFTALESSWPAIERAALETGCQAIRIGQVTTGEGVQVLLPDGGEYTPARRGYEHGGSDG